jgi:hypothetical protein
VVRGRRSVLVPAGCTVAAATLVAATVGNGSDLVIWTRDVLPTASRGSTFAANQSLPAWIERITSSATDFNEHVPLGTLNRLGPLITVVGLGMLAQRRRGTTFDPMEIGVGVLVVLVAGPLSWDHYYVWVVLPLVLACDPQRWRDLGVHRRLVAGALAAAVAILSFRTAVPSSASIAADGSLRLGTGAYVLAGVLMLAGCSALLAPRRTCVRSEPPPGTMAGLWRTRSSSGAPGSTISATSIWSSRATG